MSCRVPACESAVNSIWRRMQQAWTVTAFRESRGAPRRFRSAERGNATSSRLLIERVGSVAPAQLSVKARPVKSTLPALHSCEGTRVPARLRLGLRHRSAVAPERLAFAQGVAARLSDRRRRPFAMPRARPESGWPGRRSESAPRRVVPQINEIGQLTGKQRIGEFAENAEIIQVLTSLGVDYAQGYGVAQPQRVVQSAVA